MEQKNLKTFTEDDVKEIRNLVALDVPSGEIAQKMNCKMATIRNAKFLFGMYSKEQILQLLTLYRDRSEIANISGVSENIIIKIADDEELEAREVKIRKKLKSASGMSLIEIESEIRRLVALDVSTKEIGDRMYYSARYIERAREKLGTYSGIQILQLLEMNYSYEQVKTIAQVDEQTIKELESKKKRKMQERDKKQEDKEERKSKSEKRIQDIRILLAEGESYETIRKKFGYNGTRTVYCIKRRNGMITRSEIVKLMLDGKSNKEIEEISAIPIDLIEEIREKEISLKKKTLKVEMKKLRDMVKSPNGLSKKADIKKMIQQMLKEYESFLTDMEYVFISYTYVKLGDVNKAVAIAREHMQLDNATPSDVRKLIFKATNYEPVTVFNPTTIKTKVDITDCAIEI